MGKDKEAIKMTVRVPTGCNVCGATRENLVIAFGGNGFLTMATAIPGLVMFACPRCNCLMVNPDAFSGMIEAKKKEGPKIVAPNEVERSVVDKSRAFS